ncbi:MAG: phosphodiester glycosidase family protein [Bacteroidales bacterium]|nr:phosphodiester glycosidase family protein [Bacteroidales bacterium]
MKKMIGIIGVLALAVSCNQAASTDMPEWRWKDPEPVVEPPFVEPHPAIEALGWTNVTANYTALPDGLALYRSPETMENVKVIAYIAVAELSKLDWDVKSIDDPDISGTSDPLKTPDQYYKETAAPVIINGGYFFSEGGKNYNASVAVSGGKTYGVNINYASVDWETFYYPTRGVFYQNASSDPAVGWTYWPGGAAHYLYSEPAANAWDAAPLQTPDANFPVKASDFAPQTAIGGGPVLLKDGNVVNSWKAELLYGDGADDKMPEARHPRTAIGVTADGLLILFVCEGRGMTEGVAGMTFAEEAAVLKSLGCVHALNLDGGGSSCLLVNGQETIKVSDGSQRPVSSVVVLKAK